MLKHFYLATPLHANQTITLPKPLQHRLAKVLRLGQGAEVGLFNGMPSNQNGGLFLAKLLDNHARTAQITTQLSPTPTQTGLVLVLGIPKREAWETALRQATELGVSAIQPLKTEFCQVGKLNTERAQTIMIEAAEQSERLNIPQLLPLQTLESFLAQLQTPCLWAAERASTKPLSTQPNQVLIGPEGGFSPTEKSQLQTHPHIHPISLGPTILRTDTAVVATFSKFI